MVILFSAIKKLKLTVFFSLDLGMINRCFMHILSFYKDSSAKIHSIMV